MTTAWTRLNRGSDDDDETATISPSLVVQVEAEPRDELLFPWLSSPPVSDPSLFNPYGTGRDDSLSRFKTSMARLDALAFARSFELYHMHCVHTELKDGDTLVFIDFPNAPKDRRRLADCHRFAYRSQQFRVHSEKLLATGSPKFADMLNPTHQFRAQRRRKMVNKLPAGVKYVLDLTPPYEGDDLVFQMTELSLTPGITRWWSSHILHQVDESLVGGHDDICSCNRPIPGNLHSAGKVDAAQDSLQDPPEPSQLSQADGTETRVDKILQMKAAGQNQLYETPDYRDIPDYCPFRHCNTIIRLLRLIEGRGVLFDSAIRVWTLVAMAKIFDCVSVVRDQVSSWMMSGNNTRFIEILPEEALQIGFTLEIPEATQSSFRILVNELALDDAATDPPSRENQKTTAFGRQRGDLPDELSNLVQHAARAFVERVSGMMAQLDNPSNFDFWDVGEWNKLRALEHQLKMQDAGVMADALKALQQLMDMIATRFQATFRTALTYVNGVHAGTVFMSMDNDRATYVEPKHFQQVAVIMKEFNNTQKMLCPFIYTELSRTWEIFEVRGETIPMNLSPSGLLDHWMQRLEDALYLAVKRKPQIAQAPELEELFLDWPSAAFKALRKPKSPLVDFSTMETQVGEAMRSITDCWIRHEIDPPLNLTRHMLLTLTSNELKYLPLWAGGCNDGTGGVFEHFVPPTDMGPNGPGPAYHTGLTLPSGPPSLSDSLMEDITALNVRGSTVAESLDVHDSVSTVYRPDQVIADDHSVVSEEFTSGESDYQRAEFAVPAEHQGMGEAVDRLVESATDSETQSVDFDLDYPGDLDEHEGTHTPTADMDWDWDSDSDGSVVFIPSSDAKK